MTSTPTAAEVDELAAAARADTTPATLSRLWQAVFRLEHWWLLPTGDAADPRPMVGVVEDKAFLLAFTSRDHVRDFVLRQDQQVAGDGLPTMGVTPGDVAELVPTLAKQGIAGIIFDQGVHGFMAPVVQLEALMAQFGPGPVRDTGPPAGDAASDG